MRMQKLFCIRNLLTFSESIFVTLSVNYYTKFVIRVIYSCTNKTPKTELNDFSVNLNSELINLKIT